MSTEYKSFSTEVPDENGDQRILRRVDYYDGAWYCGCPDFYLQKWCGHCVTAQKELRRAER